MSANALSMAGMDQPHTDETAVIEVCLKRADWMGSAAANGAVISTVPSKPNRDQTEESIRWVSSTQLKLLPLLIVLNVDISPLLVGATLRSPQFESVPSRRKQCTKLLML